MLNNMLYIDPAATTALVSGITAIVVALSATFIILWRKFKKGASKVFHIDENKNKEVEEDLVITDDEIKNSDEENQVQQDNAQTENATFEDKKEEE